MKEKDEKMTMDDAMERLVQVMNDSPTIVKLKHTDFAITGLKPGTQWLIAEEACKIIKAEKGNFADVIKQFATNVPSVVKVITLAILNDKDKIFSDYTNKVFSEGYNQLYDTIMWHTDMEGWINLLVEIMSMLSMKYFFDSTNAIAMIREMALGRKKMIEEIEEQRLSSAVPNGGK